MEERTRMYDPLRSKAKVALGTAGAVLVGLGVASGLGWTHTALPDVDEQPRVSEEEVRPALDLSDAFVNLAEEVTPAVVRIEAARPGRTAGMAPNQQIPEMFRRFFPDEQLPEGGEPMPRVGGGSGFIISPDGYIMTNDHVVGTANQIVVYLTDGRYYEAELVGTDPFTDVAVIKIEVDQELPTLPLGDSDEVRVGEWVLAVGNPGFGGGGVQQLDYTVTAGIVSARGRGLQLINRELQRNERTREDAAYAIEDFIQTDAVINPGNSGGPMVDLQGRVVGVNSAIASQTGFYQGYGFAIPVNIARRVMEDLVEFGHVQRPMIGVSIRDIRPEDAEIYGLPRVSGALVERVEPGSPAERAGLQAEDVVVEVNDQPVGYSNQLQARVAQYHPGDRVTVGYYRNGELRETEVRLGQAPINDVPERAAERLEGAGDRLGIQVETLSAQEAERYGFSGGAGVVISGVAPLSPAQRAGVPPGAKLVAINDAQVETPADVGTALEGIEPGQIVTLHLDIQGTPRIVNVRMPQR